MWRTWANQYKELNNLMDRKVTSKKKRINDWQSMKRWTFSFGEKVSILQVLRDRSVVLRGSLFGRCLVAQSCPTLWDPWTVAHQAPPSLGFSRQENSGVGCHFLLQGMKVKSESEVSQSCLSLRNPMDCSLPGSSIHGIFQARVLEWGAIAFSANLYSLQQNRRCWERLTQVLVNSHWLYLVLLSSSLSCGLQALASDKQATALQR